MPNSYTRAEVYANLPLADMEAHFGASGNRGKKVAFYETVPNADTNNLPYNMTRLHKNPAQQKVGTGDTSLDAIRTAWERYVANGYQVPNKPGSGNGGNSNGGNANAQPTGTQVRRAEESAEVPPVAPVIRDNALSVFNMVRDNKIDPPQDAQSAYALLWDNLDATVRIGHLSDVLVNSMRRVAAEKPEIFSTLFSTLPDEVKESLYDVMANRAKDILDASVKTSVERAFHISTGKRHAASQFGNWDDAVKRYVNFIGRAEDADWTPTDAQRSEAARDTAVEVFRTLYQGLRDEVAANQPPPPAGPQKMAFDNLMTLWDEAIERQVLSDAEFMGLARGGWAKLSAEDQHAKVEDVAAKVKTARESASSAGADETETGTPSPEVQPETPTSGTNRPRQ